MGGEVDKTIYVRHKLPIQLFKYIITQKLAYKVFKVDIN